MCLQGKDGSTDKQIGSKSLELRRAVLQVLLDDCDKMADAAHVVVTFPCPYCTLLREHRTGIASFMSYALQI